MLPIIYRIYQFSNNGFYIVLLLGAMSILSSWAESSISMSLS